MFNIDYNKRQPINEQIFDQVVRYILIGVFKPGEWLPSVRQLATELSINPNTIQKAYSELENNQIIIPVKGKGSFITEDLNVIRQYSRNKIESSLYKTISDAKLASWNSDEFITAVNKIWKEGIPQ